MQRTAKSLAGLGAALVGLGLAFIHAPIGVAVTIVGTVVAFPMTRVNLPAARAAYYAALFCYAAALYRGSGSALLAAVPLPIGMALCPTELLLGRGPRVTLITPMIAAAASVAVFVLAWPTGWWGLALAPCAMAVTMTLQLLKIMRTHTAFLARPKLLKVGQEMPRLSLPRRDGTGAFDLSDQKGRFTLLCFLRGDWCPMCHVMMRLFRREAPRLAEHNVQLVSITPDSGPVAQEFARDLGLDYTILVDEHARIAAEWGMIDAAVRDGDPIPMPICLLVDPEGILRFVSRPDDFSTFVDESRVLLLVEGHARKAA